MTLGAQLFSFQSRESEQTTAPDLVHLGMTETVWEQTGKDFTQVCPVLEFGE